LLLLVVILLGGLLVYWRVTVGKGLSASATRILVLDDCDADFRTPPFEDGVITFNAKGKPAPKVSGFNICQTVGGCRTLAVSKDGGFFVVCENVNGGLSAYRASTGEKLWGFSNADQFSSATVAADGTVYALTSAGQIYGKDILAIDRAGHLMRQEAVAGFDLALDETRNALWLVGSNITRCDLELKVLLAVDSIGWCAVSVDCNADGSVGWRNASILT
jgi:outer membrane protein assembly factor BamB